MILLIFLQRLNSLKVVGEELRKDGVISLTDISVGLPAPVKFGI